MRVPPVSSAMMVTWKAVMVLADVIVMTHYSYRVA
jgi:hypothetical protein